ncbi:hypothetical protein [Streptacidiphilus sp. PAMC 29251]
MTSRMAKVSRTAKTPTVEVHCPACRALRRCGSVGTATINNRRREVLECPAPDCQLQWVPVRNHLTSAPTAA